MKYIKFLFKDIFKHKSLYIFLVFFIFLTSLIISAGIDVILDFTNKTSYSLHISKQFETLDAKDRELINETLISSNQNIAFVSDGLHGCNAYLFGDYGVITNQTYESLEDVTLTDLEYKLIKKQCEDVKKIYVYDLKEVKNIKDESIFELLIFIRNEKTIRQLVKNEYNTIKLDIKSYRDKRYEVNYYLIISIVFSISILTLLIFKNSIKYFFFMKKIEFQINQFYGSTIVSQILRLFFYIDTVFIIKIGIQILIDFPINLIVDVIMFLIIFSIMCFYVAKINEKGGE